MRQEDENQPSSPDPFRPRLIALIPHLRNFARRLCGDRDLAEDLAQGALASAWRSRDSFKTGTNLKAWVFKILRNDYYSHRRRSWRQIDWDESKGSRISAPAGAQYWALELTDATRGLNELPAGQREALILVGAGGLSYEEVAALRAIPLGTVKSRVARGRLALAEMMTGDRKFEQPIPSSALPNDIPAQLMALVNPPRPVHV
jgi:RNA polymerase sigma-70 factor (ECF subfamily)